MGRDRDILNICMYIFFDIFLIQGVHEQYFYLNPLKPIPPIWLNIFYSRQLQERLRCQNTEFLKRKTFSERDRSLLILWSVGGVHDTEQQFPIHQYNVQITAHAFGILTKKKT